jgi:spoIIIJ-associated protein
MAKNKEELEQVKEIADELLAKLEIAGDVTVAVDETDAYRVHVATEETGLLIGFHGRTLESIQIILGILVSKKLGKWVRVYVNIGDYREKREEALMHMAQRAAERAMAIGRPVELTSLSASERRVIHLTLSGDERVTTESVGEGDHRILLVKPKETPPEE